MKESADFPDALWQSEVRQDEETYLKIVKRLDLQGKLVDRSEVQYPLLTSKFRVYHLPRATVVLSETLNSCLNNYAVNVRVSVYASNEKSAKKLLEGIIK